MQIFNKHHLKNGLTDEHFYIGRGSPYGNPFSREKFRNDLAFIVEAHKLLFLNRLANQAKETKELWLNDKDMVCFCKPKPCHGDIIKEFWDLHTEVNGSYKEARKLFLQKHNYVFLPDREGIDHINIYSKSRTRLGLLCSNFAHTPFTHPEYGFFASMEAFWFYVGTGFKHEHLRPLIGYEAKKVGSSYPKVPIDNFLDIIEEGIRCKVDQHEELRELLTINHLPFKHYYFYGNDGDYKCVPEGDGFLEGVFTRISLELGQHIKLLIAGSRDFVDILEVVSIIASSGLRISEIVEGGARGADLCGWYYGMLNKIPVKTFAVTKEEWEASKGAGIQRNVKMGDYADRGIVFINNNSKGSTHMAGYLKKLGKDPIVKHYTK